MNVTGMSIANMTSVSYLLFVISGVFAVTAAVLFFVLDIAKCWRMVSGRPPVPRKKRQKANRAASVYQAKTEKPGQFPTEKISGHEISAGCEETVLLDCTGAEGTELPDTDSLEMIQDIVYMQSAVKIDKGGIFYGK